MELYLRYDPEEQPPLKVSGVITWHSLGDTKTEISGTLSTDGTLNFQEVRCLAGDCGKVVLGGQYSARHSKNSSSLSGTASGSSALEGNFELKREAKN